MQRLIDADAIEFPDANSWEETHEDEDYGYGMGVGECIEIIEKMPTIDAVPIEFIEKRIAELKKLNEYEFIANGGYTSPSDYEQWELERLVREWRKEHAETD